MWSKIKMALGVVAGILFGVCGFIVGSKRRGSTGNVGSDRVEGRHTGEDIGRLEERADRAGREVRDSVERQGRLVDEGTQVVGDLKRLLDQVAKDQPGSGPDSGH